MDPGVVLVVAQDVGTALCAVFNGAYFSLLWLRAKGSQSRRLAAAALALINAAIALESLFFQAIYWCYGMGVSIDALLSPGVWLATRFLPFAAAALMTILILRRARTL
jgi:hypothetical protein